jgi:hypothetical protein
LVIQLRGVVLTDRRGRARLAVNLAELLKTMRDIDRLDEPVIVDDPAEPEPVEEDYDPAVTCY